MLATSLPPASESRREASRGSVFWVTGLSGGRQDHRGYGALAATAGCGAFGGVPQREYAARDGCQGLGHDSERPGAPRPLLKFTPGGWRAVEALPAGLEEPVRDRLNMTGLRRRLLAARAVPTRTLGRRSMGRHRQPGRCRSLSKDAGGRRVRARGWSRAGAPTGPGMSPN
jgi:hypothetical protein